MITIFILQLLLSTVFLLGWYYVAMWFLRRMHHIREEGIIVYFTTLALVSLGVITDVLYNLTFGTLIFLDVPRVWTGEVTLSQRLKRIRKTGRGYRLRLADYICERWLNPKDPKGHHC